MKRETGIIMSGNHPKLIIDGLKTMTRRVIKADIPSDVSLYLADGYLSAIHPKNFHRWFFVTDKKGRKIKCPYGQVGDLLWVKETWKYYNCSDLIAYKADGDLHGRWKPSIHMFRKDSRLTLEITEVRVERLQEISWDESHQEGILRFDRDNPDPSNSGGMGYNRGAVGLPERYESITAFSDLWDSLNAKRGYGWETNPWVWVIEFGIMGVRVK